MGYHLIRNDLNINFVGLRKIAYVISILFILAGVASLIIKGGPKYGIDFAGGATVQIKFDSPLADESIKNALSGTNIPGLAVQKLGSDDTMYLIRLAVTDETSQSIVQTIDKALQNNLSGNTFEIVSSEMVGPKVGADLRSSALEAMFFAILITAFYISGRFEYRWFTAGLMVGVLGGITYVLGGLFAIDKVYLIICAILITILYCLQFKLVFALGAIISILHDVLITVGLFSILDKEFDLTIVAALMTIVGYSLNDTIIIYDRIRENLRSNLDTPLSVIINQSINQTLSRTILTSGSTLIVIIALLIWGGGIIHDFSLVMFIGVIIGTISSMFVASPILLAFGDTIISHAHLLEDKRPRDADGRVAGQV